MFSMSATKTASLRMRSSATRTLRNLMPHRRVAALRTTSVVRAQLELDVSYKEDAYSDSISSWEELASMASLAYAVSAGAGNQGDIYRVMAAETITANTTFDTLSPPGAVQEFTALLEGELFNVTTIVDTHYRLLKDCLIQDHYDLLTDTYYQLANVEPKLEEELIIATATVAIAALETLKEEHSFVESMLEEQVVEGAVDEEMRKDYYIAHNVVKAVDKVNTMLIPYTQAS